MNIIMNDAHSYVRRVNAVAQLEDTLNMLGIQHARCLIISTDNGRYVPAVLQSSIDASMIMPLVSSKISVVG